MNLTGKQLAAIMPRCPYPESYAAILTMESMTAGISTVTASAAFLATLAEESGELRILEEAGDHSYLGADAKWYGRGWGQHTGEANYKWLSGAIGMDLIAKPELLLDPQVSGAAATAFWKVGAGLRLSPAAKAHGLPSGCDLSDIANRPDITGVRLAWNGGLNGLDVVLDYYHRALEVLGVGALA